MYNNIIELDIWSKFGCFSKPFSNSGGIMTYLIPPKTSIIGMIGAILGYRFDDYKIINNDRKFKIEELFEIKISIQPLFSFKTKRIIYNLIEQNEIKNIKQDILINPYYKIYISFPETLKDKENLFLSRIKNHKSVFNLYMGRNEFLLNYSLKNFYENVEKIQLNSDEENNFFNENKNRIYGLLNRECVENTSLNESKTNNNIPKALISIAPSTTNIKLEDCYEYLINEYPISRKNFYDFKYSKVSFYSMQENDDYFFNYITLKKGNKLMLYKIGENKWISMI